MNPAEALAQLARAMLNGGPPRPQGVRVRIGDQYIEPVELTYTGQNPLGNHEWLATFDVDGDDVDGVHVDVLPGRTSVALAFPISPENSP